MLPVRAASVTFALPEAALMVPFPLNTMLPAVMESARAVTMGALTVVPPVPANSVNDPALKPFVYALGIDQGLYTPASLIADVPLVLADYRPQNFEREFSGPVTVREALVRSLNIPALRATQAVGQENVVRLLRAAGLTTGIAAADRNCWSGRRGKCRASDSSGSGQ